MKVIGKLTLPAGGSGFIENARIENLASDPTPAAGENGRLLYNSSTGVLKYISSGTWTDIATGGNTGALQAEIDAIEGSLGAMVDSSGVYVPGAFPAASFVNVDGNSTDLLGALKQIDTALSAAAGVDTLGELTDVTLGTLATDDFLVYDGAGQWRNRTPAQAQIQLLLEPGVNVQVWDAGLESIAGLTGTGLVSATATDAYVLRNIVESSTNALTVTNGDGVGGDPTIDVHASLDSIAGLSTAADTMIYTTSANTYAVATLTSAGRDLIDDASAADQRATLGLVAGGSGDIWVKTAGDTMAGSLNMGTQILTNLAAPVSAKDAVTKEYADAIASGIDAKDSSRLATTAFFDATYNDTGSGASDGVGDTLTDNTPGTTTIDGVAIDTVGERILVKNQQSGGSPSRAKENGIYTVTTVGSGGGATVLTRATDFDGNPTNEVSGGAFTFVEAGTVNSNSGWIVTGSPAIPGGNIVVGVDDILFTQASGAGTIQAGLGLIKVGNTIDVNFGAGIANLPADEVGIDLYVASANALMLTTDGTNPSNVPASQLYLQLDGTTLSQTTTSGLKVNSAGITETELNASIAGNGLTGGAGTVLSVDISGGVGGSVGKLVFSTGQLGVSLGVTSLDAAAGDHSHTAAVVTYDSSGTGGDITAGNVQAAIDQVDARLDTLETTPHASQIELDATQVGAGLNTDGTYTPPTADYIGGASDLNNADDLLDAELKAANDRHSKAFFLYTGTASASHTVNHNTGQQFCNVTVIDMTGTPEVIIPDTIVFNNINTLTVTLATSLAINVAVYGAI